jgi:hypothetical protein
MDSTAISEMGQGPAVAHDFAWSIRKIEHIPDGKKPLTVSLRAGGKDFSIQCRATDVQTFPRFQTLVADQLGLWLNDDVFSGRGGKQAWTDEIEDAFERGRQ